MPSKKSLWKKLCKSVINSDNKLENSNCSYERRQMENLFQELDICSKITSNGRNNHAITFKSPDTILGENPSQYGGRIIKPTPETLRYRNLNNYTSPDIRPQNPISSRRWNNSNELPNSTVNTDQPMTMQKTPQYPAKKCLNCMNDFIPFSGDQRMCKLCVNDVIMNTSGTNIRNKRTAFHTAFHTAEDFRMDQLRASPCIFRQPERNRICTTCHEGYKVKPCGMIDKSRQCNRCFADREARKNSIIASHYSKNPPIPCPNETSSISNCRYRPNSSCESGCFSADQSIGSLSPHCRKVHSRRKCHRKRSNVCQDCLTTFMSCNPGDRDVAVFFSAILDDLRTNQIINRAIDAWNSIEENSSDNSASKPPHMFEPHKFCHL